MAFPQINSCLVCEGIRLEVLGKITVLGLYGVAPNVEISIGDFAQPVTLCFFFVGGPGNGSFSTNVRVVSQSGANVLGFPVESHFVAGKTVSFLAIMFSSQLPGPGRYRVVLTVDGADNFSTDLGFVQGNREEMLRSIRPQ